jgi:DNA-binding winged helix-turn-helix (wHTH) protein/Tol biopolymer transport system component
MRWRIAQYIFCNQQQTLSSAEKTQQLEPMMVELLSYFCQNADSIVSKDQLIEQVWLGRIVSDSAVSKVIAKLRKVLNDDVRKPSYIATFPKKGYKFIASVEPLTEPVKPSTTTFDKPQQNTEGFIDKSHPGPAATLMGTDRITPTFYALLCQHLLLLSLFFVIILFIIVMLWWPFTGHNVSPEQRMLTHARSLTTGAGQEYFPRVSPDGSSLVYMASIDNQLHLMIKDLTDERIVEVKHEADVGLGPASWSDDGSLFVYLLASPTRCQYYIRSIQGLELGEPKLIHNCPAGSYGKIAFTHDNNRLVYSEKSAKDEPYSIFAIDLRSDKIVRLNQPALYLDGNSQFDLHPTQNKLLISSPDKEQWEGFYSLDLDNNELTLLFKQDAYICCGVWSHDGNRVVLMGEHPAYQLLSYDLSGQNMQIVYLGSRQISMPYRHSNGLDYLFVAGLGNLNVALIDVQSGERKVLVDTTVDDRLAAIGPDKSQIAYIGLSTGNEEVWLTDIEASHKRKLTKFQDGRHYLDLNWSPDGRQLMALTLNEIHIIDVASGDFKRLKIPQTEIRAASFKNAYTLAFSTLIDNKWRVNFYDLHSGDVSLADEIWQFVQYHYVKEDTLWFDRDSNLYAGERPERVKVAELEKLELTNGRGFKIKKSASQWVWLGGGQGRELMYYSEKNAVSQSLIQVETGQFDFHNGKLLYTEVDRSEADIFTTQSFKVK